MMSDLPSDERPAISAVLPAYNEQGNIEQAMGSLLTYLRSRCGRYELIVVDDGSRDATGDVARGIAAGDPAVKVIRRETNRGYGAALRSGFAVATLPLVFYTDSDNQFVPAEIDKLLPLVEEADIVTGYRHHRQDSWRRKFTSWLFRRFVHTFFGISLRDVDCSFKLYRREVFDRLALCSDGFFIDTELFYQAARAGLRIDEVPVTHLPRSVGTSTVTMRRALYTVIEAWRVWRHRNAVIEPATDSNEVVPASAGSDPRG